MGERLNSNELAQWFCDGEVKLVKNSSVVLMAGFNGCGKSWVARSIYASFGGEILRSDAIRQQLFKGSNEMELDSGTYLERYNAVYNYMLKRALLLARGGGRAIIDATHLNDKRAETISHLDRCGILDSSVMVLVETDKEIIRQRQRMREGRPNDKETWEEAWERVYGWFESKIVDGTYSYPSDKEGLKIIRVRNS